MSEQPTVQVKASGTAEATGAIHPELLISALLRYGVVASLALVFAGTAMTFVRHPDYFSSNDALHRLTAGENLPHQLSDVLAGVRDVHGQAVAMVGLLLMMAIPVARVALSLLIFRQQRDGVFVAVTSLVLALLVLSFALGRAE